MIRTLLEASICSAVEFEDEDGEGEESGLPQYIEDDEPTKPARSQKSFNMLQAAFDRWREYSVRRATGIPPSSCSF